MLPTLTERQKGVAYYLVTLALATLVAIVGPANADRLQILSMLTATAGVLLMLLVITRDGLRRSGWAQLALHRPGFRYWPLALLLPTIVLVVSYSAATLVGAVSWHFTGDAVPNLVAGVVVASLFAIFEEVGWRGYLLPTLAVDNKRAAPAIVGFLHGVWHLPLMLLTTAYNPVGNRWIVVPLFLAILTAAGVLYGYLRDASGSIWPVIIAHGTFNAVLGSLASAVASDNPLTTAYLTGETGVFTLLAVTATAWVLTARPAWLPRFRTDLGVTRPSA